MKVRVVLEISGVLNAQVSPSLFLAFSVGHGDIPGASNGISQSMIYSGAPPGIRTKNGIWAAQTYSQKLC